MMTPAPNNDILAEAPDAQAAPAAPVAQAAGEVPGSTLSSGALEATELESSDLTVLQAVMSHGEPVTASRLVRTTGLQAAELSAILESLHELRLLRRLNTVVPSYLARR
jgi:hypothetical protein